LEETRQVIRRDALYDVKLEEVEDFCYWWPESSKEKFRRKKGVDELISDIRKSFASDPFVIPPYDDADKYETPQPPIVDVKIGNEICHNFLRNWTAIVEKPRNLLAGTVVREFAPPKGYYNLEWIPAEYYTLVEKTFDLTPFYYVSADTFRTIYRVFDSKDEKDTRTVVETDATGRKHITISMRNGKV
jgi:hypothetical protein